MHRTVRALALATVIGGTASLLTSCTPAPTPIQLTLPASTAFSVLGHSCGGIQQQDLVTGFAADTGYVTGAVYLQTRCSTGGRGGGTVTYTAWATTAWDLTGTVRSVTKLGAAPTGLDSTLSVVDGSGDHAYNQLTATNLSPDACTAGNTTYCTYKALLTVPVPVAPNAVSVSQQGDALAVTWTYSGNLAAVTSTTVTATPTGGGTALTATVTGTSTTASVNGVLPSTEYSVSVVVTDVSGTGPASSPTRFTTHAATVAPGAPTGVTAGWLGTGIKVTWTAASPGDSPISAQEVRYATYDPTGAWTSVSMDAASTTATLNGLDTTLSWQVQVRARNTVGWGPWSTAAVLPALD